MISLLKAIAGTFTTFLFYSCFFPSFAFLIKSKLSHLIRFNIWGMFSMTIQVKSDLVIYHLLVKILAVGNTILQRYAALLLLSEVKRLTTRFLHIARDGCITRVRFSKDNRKAKDTILKCFFLHQCDKVTGFFFRSCIAIPEQIPWLINQQILACYLYYNKEKSRIAKINEVLSLVGISRARPIHYPVVVDICVFSWIGIDRYVHVFADSLVDDIKIIGIDIGL